MDFIEPLFEYYKGGVHVYYQIILLGIIEPLFECYRGGIHVYYQIILLGIIEPPFECYKGGILFDQPTGHFDVLLVCIYNHL